MIFYLGIHEPTWLPKVDVPTMVSRNRLGRGGRRMPRANHRWVLDSGGFTEIAQHGRWRISAAQYADEIAHIAAAVLNVEQAQTLREQVEWGSR